MCLIEKKTNTIIHLYRIKKHMVHYNETLLNDITTMNFDTVKKYVLDSKHISKVFQLLSSIYKYLILTYPIKDKCVKPYKTQAKLFLSHLLISQCPTDVLGEEKTRTLKTRTLYRASTRLYATFKLLSINWFNKKYLLMFMNYFKSYMETFIEWQKSDKEQLIGKMSHNYWELEITKKNIEISNDSKESLGTSPPNNNRQDIIKSIDTMQKDIINNIICLDKKGMDIFNQYIPIVYTHDFMENVRDTLEVVFWNTIRMDMKAIPAKTVTFRAVLQELLDNLRTICVSDYQYQTDLTEFYDIDLLLQMIIGDAYSLDMLMAHWEQLIGILINYDAPVNDSSNIELKTDIEKKIHTMYALPLQILNKHIEGWILILGELLPRFININSIKTMMMSQDIK